MYEKMPIGLMNAGATFQRAMDVAFVGGKYKFIAIYIDDVTVFSQSEEEHIHHLKQTFKKCRKFGISLNPEKYLFVMDEGKLLGHSVFAHGVSVDPERFKAIQKLEIPRHKKGTQGFLGKINFLRRFIPNLAKILKPISDMLKKDADIKWDSKARLAFQWVKDTLITTLVLASPKYDREFIVFSFASHETITVVLLQKIDEGYEKPISLFSRALRDA